MARNIKVGAVYALSLFAVSACSTGDAKLDQEGGEDAAALPVEVTRPRVADVHATYETTATITADAEADVPARVSGEVVELVVEEGDRVAAGQVLARLDGDRLRLQMEQARAKLEIAAGEHDRLHRLRERGLVSAASLEALEFEKHALEAVYELHRLNHAYTTIRAPISGVISGRHVKLGAHVEVGEVLFRVTDTTSLMAGLHIPQTRLGLVEAADTAVVRADALPDRRFSASILRISPTIDARTGTFRATARIDNSAGLLAPGMFTRFSVTHDTHHGALVVPSSVIIREDNDSIVYVVSEGAVSRRQVVTGMQAGGKTEVLKGLSTEDLVVITGQTGLRDGSKVLARVRPDDGITG